MVSRYGDCAKAIIVILKKDVYGWFLEAPMSRNQG